MTIASSPRKAGPYTGTGTTYNYPFAFKVFASSDLEVIKYDETLEEETTLSLTADYSVSLNADQDDDPGGIITLVVALESGYLLTITSDQSYDQPTELANQGGFYPSVINDALDRLTIQTQQLSEQISRAIKTPISETTSSSELTSAIIEVAAHLATGYPTFSVFRETLIADTEFVDTGAYKIVAFVDAYDAEYEYIPDGLFTDGLELVIINTGTTYDVVFQGDSVSPGSRQSYYYDLTTETWRKRWLKK